MKPYSRKYAIAACGLLTAFGLLTFTAPLQAQGNKTFAGNGLTGFGGPIGTATLQITDDTTNLSGTLTVFQNNTGGNVYVIYLQCGTNGGVANTSGLNDQSDGIHSAICGFQNANRSVLTFLPGFTPNYALGIQLGNFAGIYGVTNTSNLPYHGSMNLTPSSGSGSGVYTFTVPLASIGLPTGPSVVGTTIKLLGNLVSGSGYRANECLGGNTDGTQGWNPTAQTALGTYLVGEVPTITYPVNFQVDVSTLLTNGDFNPGSGDVLEARGTFNANAAGFSLVASSNPNIYTNTFADANALGTAETYKFDIVHFSTTQFEQTDARSFVLASNLTLPVVYFSDSAPLTNATVPLTFFVNMSVQEGAGRFNPGNGDQVYAFGVFDQDANFQWQAGTPLTPTGTNPAVFTGTMGDGNYAGTAGQYKFVIITAGNVTNYESTPNRQYITPVTSATFPTVYFNNQSNVVNVGFSVDMSAQILQGTFTPGVDTVVIAGSLQGWNTTANPLTNNPAASNTNVYSGTVPDFDPVATTEYYKFVQYGAGISGNAYESPVSTGGNNRSFVLPATSTNLPTVFFSDVGTSDLLPADTEVTFSVNMANAVGTDAAVFSEGNTVAINGDFIGWNGNSWNNFLPTMTETGSGTLIYTYQTLFLKGSSVIVNYKYGINFVDDEAAQNVNHVRYIRSTGTYNMPLDKFGQGVTNAASIVEPSFGSLAIGSPSGGTIPITWLGRTGVHLQSRTNLTSGSWVDLPATDGTSSTNIPFTGTSQYFRLVHPLQ